MMKRIRRIVVISLTLLLLIPLWGLANDPSAVDVSFTSTLQLALESSFSPSDVMGCSATVLLADGAMWQGVTGLSCEGVPVSSDMLFSVGSITKNYVVAVTLQLAEEGALSLDDPLSRWLTPRPFIDDTILIRQLLSQRSGLCNVTDLPELWDRVFEQPDKIWPPEEVLDSYVGDPCFPPGTTWHYSNTGYLLLGMVLEEVTGRKVSEVVRTRLLNPLCLGQTFFAVEEGFPEEVAVCHGWFDLDHDGVLDDVTPHRRGIYSVMGTSGAVFATASDLARWVDALLRSDVLSDASLEEMLTPYSIVPDSGGVGYGFAVTLYGQDGVGHSGRTFGYLSLFLHLREPAATIVVLMNGDDATCLDAVASAFTLVVLQSAG